MACRGRSGLGGVGGSDGPIGHGCTVEGAWGRGKHGGPPACRPRVSVREAPETARGTLNVGFGWRVTPESSMILGLLCGRLLHPTS